MTRSTTKRPLGGFFARLHTYFPRAIRAVMNVWFRCSYCGAEAKPSQQQLVCNNFACLDPEWTASLWQPCNSTCGHSGVQVWLSQSLCQRPYSYGSQPGIPSSRTPNQFGLILTHLELKRKLTLHVIIGLREGTSATSGSSGTSKWRLT